MGIRYYAYPVAADFIEHAVADPFLFLSDDPLADAWGPKSDQPRMLYLDKCWAALQRLFEAPFGQPPRAAFRLVEGDVTMHAEGWYPWTRVLDPTEVAAIARDISLVTDHDVVGLFPPERTRTTLDTCGYVLHFLHEAQSFVTAMERDGHGLVYMIG